MGLQLTATGDTPQDISNIIDQLNSQANSNSITNALNISAYGQLELDVPNEEGIVVTNSFQHNLDYAPMFFVKNVANDGTNFDMPFIDALYFYDPATSGKTPGAYPFVAFNAHVDEESLTITISSLTNGSGLTEPGIYLFSFYILTRPIVAST